MPRAFGYRYLVEEAPDAGEPSFFSRISVLRLTRKVSTSGSNCHEVHLLFARLYREAMQTAELRLIRKLKTVDKEAFSNRESLLDSVAA